MDIQLVEIERLIVLKDEQNRLLELAWTQEGKIKVQRTFQRGGKTFTQTFWVKPSDVKPGDVKPEEVKPEGGDKGTDEASKRFWDYLEQHPGELKPSGEKSKVKYEGEIPGLYGRLPVYDSLPKIVKLGRITEKMNKIRNKSHDLNREIGCGIVRYKGEVMLKGETIGDDHSVSFHHTRFGAYHTHPGNPDHDFYNCFSTNDLAPLLWGSDKMAIAQNTKDGTMWVAINSSQTPWVARKTDVRSTLLILEASLPLYLEGVDNRPRRFRRLILTLCRKFKVKLYYGHPATGMEEYNGEW